MQLSLNGAGLGAGKLSFLEFAELAQRHDFAGVDFGVGGAQQAAAALGGVSGLIDALAERRVAPATFGLDVEWRRDDAVFAEGLAALPEKAAFARALGCDRCCTWMPPATNDDPTAWRQRTVERFRKIGTVLANEGIRFGL